MERPTITHQAEMSGQQVLSLYAQGYQVTCRYCKVPFVTRPELLEPGASPQYVACPKNQNHFSLITEPADRMNEMRERMDDRRKNQ